MKTNFAHRWTAIRGPACASDRRLDQPLEKAAQTVAARRFGLAGDHAGEGAAMRHHAWRLDHGGDLRRPVDKALATAERGQQVERVDAVLNHQHHRPRTKHRQHLPRHSLGIL